MASRVRKRILFCETNSTPQRPIEPHEIRVIPKGTAPCTNSAACAALAQFGDSLEKITCDYDDYLLRISLCKFEYKGEITLADSRKKHLSYGILKC